MPGKESRTVGVLCSDCSTPDRLKVTKSTLMHIEGNGLSRVVQSHREKGYWRIMICTNCKSHNLKFYEKGKNS